MTTTVDPRTILANALTYLRTSPDWCKAGNTWIQLGGCRIALDPQGIELISYRGTTGGPLVGFQPPPDPWDAPDAWPADWSRSAAEAVDVLCAKGILPLRLSTGWQAGITARATEIKQLKQRVMLLEQAMVGGRYGLTDKARTALDAGLAVAS